MFNHFKRESKEVIKDTVDISYSGIHKFVTSGIENEYSSKGWGYKSTLYLKSDNAKAEFILDGNNYSLSIRPFIRVGQYDSLEEAYLGAIDMDEKDIIEELKTNIKKEVSKKLFELRVDSAKALFDKKVININMNFTAEKSELLNRQ